MDLQSVLTAIPQLAWLAPWAKLLAIILAGASIIAGRITASLPPPTSKKLRLLWATLNILAQNTGYAKNATPSDN